MRHAIIYPINQKIMCANIRIYKKSIREKIFIYLINYLSHLQILNLRQNLIINLSG